MPYFLKVIELSLASHGAANMEHGDTQNVIEDMLKTTGFGNLERGTINVINEWPGADCRSSIGSRRAIGACDRGRWV